MATFTGVVKAYASDNNPLQTIIELVITPFGPNKNKQAIPRTEAENILRTCVYQPIKIDLEGETLGGHKGSIPVGTITYAEENEEAIIGRGVIWPEEFPEVANYLKKRTAEDNPPGTSWEILYEGSYTEGDIEYLTGTYYAANTIVANPSYGDKTLIKCVAEDLKLDDLKIGESSLEEERNEILELQNMVSSLYGMLDDLWYKTFEIEEAEMTKTESMDGFSTRMQDLISRLTNRAEEAGVALAETKTTVDTLQTKLTELQTELDTLKSEKAQAEVEAKNSARKAQLAEAGVEVDNIDTLLTLDDNAFTLFVSTIKQVKGKSVAETKINIELPEINSPSEITTEDIVESHKSYTKKGNRK